MLRIEDLLKVTHNDNLNIDKLKTRKFKGVSIDSRAIKKNEIFFAIKGDKTDGHKFIRDVFEKGVEAAVVNRSWYSKNKNKYPDKAFITVDDTTSALGEFAKIHKKNFNLPVLCIAGSNGKTTTKDLIATVLSQKFNVLKTEGNFNNHIGLPLTLLRLNSKHTFCVLEAGCNHFRELKYLCGIAEPDFGLVTNIGKEHLEFFKDLNGVAKAEFELFDYLIKKEKTKLFLNLDDKFIIKYSGRVKNEKKFTYSYKHNPDVKGRFKDYNKDFEPNIEIEYKKEKFETSIATFGKHSVYNGLAAAATGLYFGIGKNKIKKALKNFSQSSSKRMEVLKTNGMTIINDTYNSNPESVMMGIETMMEFDTKGRKFAVLADMLELGKSSKREHSDIGKFAERRGVKNLYTFGVESYHTFYNARKVKNNLHFESKQNMIEFLRKNIDKGDLIYVKGSRGMKMEEVVNALRKL